MLFPFFKTITDNAVVSIPAPVSLHDCANVLLGEKHSSGTANAHTFNITF